MFGVYLFVSSFVALLFVIMVSFCCCWVLCLGCYCVVVLLDVVF